MDAISYAKASSAYKLASLANAGLVDKANMEGSSILVPVGTTDTRPVLGAGESALRYNSDAGGLEEWTGTEWKNVSAAISAVSMQGKDTEANILAKVGMVAEDLWIASDTLDGWVYDGTTWVNIGPLQGPQGVQGVQGPQGIQGIQGDIGPKGDTGDQGIQGIQGIQGLKGDTGDSLTITSVVDNLDGTYTWNFSDTTSFITSNLIGPQGIKGDTGEGLNILGSLTDESLLPVDNSIGDGYIVSGYLYVWTGLVWENVGLLQGPKGDAGLAGSVWLTGAIDPTTEGVDTDMYLNTATMDIFKNTSGVWTLETNIMGIQGIQGIQGEIGLQGPQGPIGETGPQGLIGETGAGLVVKGTDTVANILLKPGVEGDFWIASDTGDGYSYVSGSWVNTGQVRGPQGEQGYQGIQGETGPQGVTGNGVASIVKTATLGLIDTYTVTFTDATTTTFDVANGLDGLDVDHIAKTSGTGAAGTVDMYTVWGDVAETVNLGTFNVYNGQDGTGSINDTTITTTTLWSSKKINDEILAMSIALG